ncbi:hypothetical protein [Zavarzinella formosa]|uniref:hypothetical protein n=1 Tax=Zavarzinella formosa TaxID=360055 RepID=UPI0002EC302E|nr:hypothetical protein [Zavarzinella formosa]
MDESKRSGRWRGMAWLAAGWICGFGCMSFNLGNRTYESPSSYVDHAGVLRQTGEAPLIRTQDDRIEVYYPRAYSTKPNLTLGKQAPSVSMEEVELLEQAPDHFTVRWKGKAGGEASLSWHAEGVPGALPVDTTPAKTTAQVKTVAPAGGS